MRLEDLQPNVAVRGILPEALVTVVSVQWYGDNALELTYKDPAGRVANEVLYRSDEARLEVAEKGKPWSFDGDGKLFRLVAEAHRIRLAHPFDPVLAVHTSLAADKARMQDLDEATRKYLAWKSIETEANELNLDVQQRRQAQTQLKTAESMMLARIPETYQWLLVPVQANPQKAMTFETARLTGGDALAVRASKKLKSGDLLVTSLGPTMLRKHLDDVPLWTEGHVSIRLLVDYFATYIYLPRLAGSDVLVAAIRAGLALLTWTSDSFAFADSFDDSAKRYRGLRAGQNVAVTADGAGLLVRPDIARRQIEAEVQPSPGGPRQTVPGAGPVVGPGSGGGTGEPVRTVRRYFGAVTLDPTRAGRDAGRAAEEVIAHLVGLPGADVTVKLEIAADLPQGASDQVVRTVVENGRTLKFNPHAFERD